MIIRRARMGDIDTILDWRTQRAAWLAERGQAQWQTPWPRWAIAAAIQAGQTWLAYEGDTAAASITLTAYADLDGLWKSDRAPDADTLWHPADDPGNALYASKMMVPLAHAGSGLGSELLDWAAGRAYDAGVLWLRLDAWTTNADLHAYYAALGFEHVRTVASRASGACFQRPAQPYHGTRLKEDS
ncbi:GNAT family N-acetyltransferase [Catellatospora paridis]|uniref:GNAT family N-acetyltransferase n=1 Tax=Catellatospora paridis TaxID=1617086 RepID=UPI0012D3B2FA|nr:GNAT family N-acetyltransferase [Catellatospora paridis]